MNIANRIKYFRTMKGYSVNKLANLSGVSQSYLRDVELGNKNPTVEFISILCDTLDISLKDFFDEETENSFTDDSLITSIYKLSPKQRDALHVFLETILEPDTISNPSNQLK